MKKYIIDGKNINSPNDFYKEFRESAKLPSYFGNNLDALWDALTGMIEIPSTVVWRDYESGLDQNDEIQKIINLIREAESEMIYLEIITAKNFNIN